MEKYVIGVDFGTASVRTLIVNARNGKQVAVAEAEYTRFKAGQYCNASKNQFRQHPSDHIESFETALAEALAQISAEQRDRIVALSVDTTGSTPVAVNSAGVPLALLPKFKDNPNAMFWLWKDHTAMAEADSINRIAKDFDTNFLKYVGGIYSSEWFWAKLMHALLVDAEVAQTTYSWVEHCDWFPFMLCGGTDANDIKRGICAAGHKALWSEEWDGLPPEEFFTALHPVLPSMLPHLHQRAYTADLAAGCLSEEWAKRLNLSTDIEVGIGILDAHVGAVGGEIEPYYLSKVMGTSTCDMLVAPPKEVGDQVVDGICGQVDGSIIPNMIGMEAGQSAFGDVYSWFRDVLVWPLRNYLAETSSERSEDVASFRDTLTDKKTLTSEDSVTSKKPTIQGQNLASKDAITSKDIVPLFEQIEGKLLANLNKAASAIEVQVDMELAVDWLNGRRTPDADQSLKAAISGLDLGTNAPRMFRALAEATCFGAKRIVERFEERGVTIKGIIGVGGVAKKSPFIMQMMADVLNRPIRIHRSEQTCALGSAMFAATVSGIYPKVEDAMKHMGQGFERTYVPNEGKTSIYRTRYISYLNLCQSIEGSSGIPNRNS